jgi:23S rRNA pseudouridine2604 synthase
MRINKYISETGIVSRREADKLVAAKRVTINGHLAELGSVVGPEDIVQLDGKPIGTKKQHIYIVLNKPVGITSTTERHVKGNIVDYVNHPERIFPIGRLDKDSEGLILLTNNGDIVNEILRAEHNHEKEYIVTVNGPVTTSFLKAMSSGVRILDTITKPCEVTRLGEREFRIILTQGLNRQIRRMCSTLGMNVVRLQRIRIMNIKLDGMKYGAWRNLSQHELNELRRMLNGQ